MMSKHLKTPKHLLPHITVEQNNSRKDAEWAEAEDRVEEAVWDEVWVEAEDSDRADIAYVQNAEHELLTREEHPAIIQNAQNVEHRWQENKIIRL